MKSFFFILTSNCRQLLAPLVGLAEEEAEVGVCEVGSTLLVVAFSILLIMIVRVVIVMYCAGWLCFTAPLTICVSGEKNRYYSIVSIRNVPVPVPAVKAGSG